MFITTRLTFQGFDSTSPRKISPRTEKFIAAFEKILRKKDGYVGNSDPIISLSTQNKQANPQSKQAVPGKSSSIIEQIGEMHGIKEEDRFSFQKIRSS